MMDMMRRIAGMFIPRLLDMMDRMIMILFHAENAENTEFFREDVRDDSRYGRERRDDLVLLDRINMMDMMPTDYRDVHTDVFRRDQQDGHDAEGPQG